MRFVLDEDVDARVRSVFINKGHDCWTIKQAGFSGASDDDVTVYASEQGAVLVTADTEFSTRRQRHTIGRHIQLRCPDLSARMVVERHLDDIVPILKAHQDVYIRLSIDRYEIVIRWE